MKMYWKWCALHNLKFRFQSDGSVRSHRRRVRQVAEGVKDHSEIDKMKKKTFQVGKHNPPLLCVLPYLFCRLHHHVEVHDIHCGLLLKQRYRIIYCAPPEYFALIGYRMTRRLNSQLDSTLSSTANSHMRRRRPNPSSSPSSISQMPTF